MYLIRDGSGFVYNEVVNPAAVYDSRDSVLLKIGEKQEMKNYFNTVQNQYRSYGFSDMADDISFMELPRDQETIDKVFQISDYIGKLHRQLLH
ncbi:hypothetical protein ANABIO32_00840 [Rossellomorea marisflavi]|uniref:hypothetical protein n=1 Tax=Rossellomorea marisflavi TaxID=189381 RepID=UPI0025CA669D|nr:hypothetical protein [Rossellomorea marisflavi]GLI82398.1 hypothetical protein ANABIO32_00840 [Rossellomorea marisflavi]